MIDYSGPCYTLPEAQDMLCLRATELAHAIRAEEIRPVVYTGLRRMLLFFPKEFDRWIGYATCQYRGHMSLFPDVIEDLLDGQTIHLGQDWGRLWDEEGVSDWYNQYPFERKLPHGDLKEWRPCERERFPINRFRATPLPKELTPAIDSFIQAASDILNAFQEDEEVQKLELPEKRGLVLNFKVNSEFKPDSLRIPASEIQRYQGKLSDQDKQLRRSAAIQQTTNNLTEGRSNQLHQLISSIIRQNPEIKAKELWKLMENDSKLDEPIFDTEHILDRVDSVCIEWCSRDGNPQSLSWNSFKPTVSKLRKKVFLRI